MGGVLTAEPEGTHGYRVRLPPEAPLPRSGSLHRPLPRGRAFLPTSHPCPAGTGPGVEPLPHTLTLAFEPTLWGPPTRPLLGRGPSPFHPQFIPSTVETSVTTLKGRALAPERLGVIEAQIQGGIGGSGGAWRGAQEGKPGLSTK